MSDNTTLNAGTGGDVIATDDVAGVKYQMVKLVDGTLDSTTVVPAVAGYGLAVNPRSTVARISVASGGLTTASTAYSAGDQVGTQFSLANAVRASAGFGTIVSVSLIDAANIIGAYNVVFSRDTVTVAADNAAASLSDADALKVIGVVNMGQPYTFTNNRVSHSGGIAIPFDCAATTLYAHLVTSQAHTFFGAVTDLQLVVYVVQD